MSEAESPNRESPEAPSDEASEPLVSAEAAPEGLSETAAAGHPNPQAPAPSEASPPRGASPEEPTRRQVLAKVAVGLSACAMAGTAGVVGVAVVGTPLAGGGSKSEWCPIGPAAEIPEGARKLPLRAPGRDAWRRLGDRALGRVVVVKEGESVQVFSAACPHNGCDVAVAESGAELLCPCHHSRFALDGERIEGQSPRGLDPLQTRVREGQLEVEFQRFAYGTAERKPS